jgi:hypothetical protein
MKLDKLMIHLRRSKRKYGNLETTDVKREKSPDVGNTSFNKKISKINENHYFQF